jgi:hypothetical protein
MFASSDDLRAQITAANAELKTARDALAAEQTKRQAAEKMVADIKAVLGVATPGGDTAASAAKPATAAK